MQPRIEVDGTDELKQFLKTYAHRSAFHKELSEDLSYAIFKSFLKEVWPILESDKVEAGSEDAKYRQDVLDALFIELISGQFKELKNLIKSYIRSSLHKKNCAFIPNTTGTFEKIFRDSIKGLTSDKASLKATFDNPTLKMYIVKGLAHASELVVSYYPSLTIGMYGDILSFATYFANIFLDYINVNKFVTFKQMQLMYEIVRIAHSILHEPVYLSFYAKDSAIEQSTADLIQILEGFYQHGSKLNKDILFHIGFIN